MVNKREVEFVSGKIIDAVIQSGVMNQGLKTITKASQDAAAQMAKRNVLNSAKATTAGILAASAASEYILPALKQTPKAIKFVADKTFSGYYNSGLTVGYATGVKAGIEQGISGYMSVLKDLALIPALRAGWELVGINPSTRLITRAAGAVVIVYGAYQTGSLLYGLFNSAVIETALSSRIRNQLIDEIDRLYLLKSIDTYKYKELLAKITSKQTVEALIELKNSFQS